MILAHLIFFFLDGASEGGGAVIVPAKPYPEPAGGPVRRAYRRRRYIINDRLYELNDAELAQALETLNREPEQVRHVKRLPKRIEAKVQQAKRESSDRAQPLSYIPVEALLPELVARLEPLPEEQITALYELLTGAMEMERERERMAQEEETMFLLMMMT